MPDLQAHSPAMGQKDGEKWTAAVDLQPTIPKPDKLLGLPNTGKLLESRLEDALIGHLQSFLLELGKGFAFVARQQRISTESKDFYLDLVFYNPRNGS